MENSFIWKLELQTEETRRDVPSVGLEVEYVGHELLPICNASIAGRELILYATVWAMRKKKSENSFKDLVQCLISSGLCK